MGVNHWHFVEIIYASTLTTATRRRTTIDGLVKTGVLLELSWGQSEPMVRLREDGARTSVLRPLIGLRLNYRASPDAKRECLGHRAFGAQGSVYIDCTRAPKPGSKKCVRCSVSDAAFAANVHHAHTQDRRNIDRLFAKHLDQQNLLYLAAFLDGSIKVGTSTEYRIPQRLQEQGAWQALLVARASDGYVVREIEDLVTEFVGTPQSVGTRRKLAGLLRPRPPGQIKANLEEAGAKAVSLLGALDDDRVGLLEEIWTNPRAGGDQWRNPLRYPIRLDLGMHNLEVVEAMGRIVALGRNEVIGRRGPEVFLADIGQLYGLVLEFGEFDSDEIVVQPALF